MAAVTDVPDAIGVVEEEGRQRRRRFAPLTQRRIDNFRKNARAYYSLWILGALFVISLLAEVIANDKPMMLQYEGDLYFPIFSVYTETEFGGEFQTEADYTDEYVQALITDSGGWMLWPLIPFHYSTIDHYLETPAPAAPSARHWLGTDDLGRDVVARLLYGFRLSFLFGLTLVFFSSIIGVSAGAVQGYFGGLVDLIFQRVIEIWAGLPLLYLLIIMASVIEPSFFWLLGLLLLFNWMALVGVVRAEFLRARNFDYVRAARGLGVSNRTIMRKHVLPNAMVATLTFLPFILSGAITLLTALDFLGLGLPPGSPSLGDLLRQGKNNLQAPWLGISGFITLATMLTLIIFVSEGVRDAFDPRKAVESGSIRA